MVDLEISLQNARILCIRHKYEEAKEIYDNILETDPMNMEANLGLLRILSKNFTDCESEEVNEEIRVFEEIFYDKDLRTLFPEYDNFLNKKENNNIEVVDAEYAENNELIVSNKKQLQMNYFDNKGLLEKIRNNYSVTINKDNVIINEFYDKTITKIDIPDGVTIIKDGVFKDFAFLSEVHLPKTLTSIGKEAFSNCKSLLSIEIPNNITIIKEKTFFGCTSLESVILPNTILSIEPHSFEGCVLLKNFKIPNSVNNIGDCSFQNCCSLKNISLPTSIVKIGNQIFKGCKELENVEIPNSIAEITWCMFDGCSSLTEVKIPFGVTSLDLSAFEDCNSLKNLELPKSLSTITKAHSRFFGTTIVITYKGTINQWNSIIINSRNTTETTYYEINCTDGIVKLLM